MATITRNLKLRLQDNLTADARYNLERIDQLGAIFQLDNSQSAVVRSQGDVTIIPNDPSIGGTGSGGDVNVGSVSQPINLMTIHGDLDAGIITSDSLTSDDLTTTSIITETIGAPLGIQFNIPTNDGVPNAVLTTDGSGNLSFVPLAGTGTVTSVALSLPDIFTVSGSPVTDNGTLTGTLNTQAASTVLAGPASGDAAVPAFRQLSTNDVTEGSNLFYTQGRFDSAFAAKTTDDLSEGVTSLYYTNLRAQDAVGSITTDSSTIDISYASGTSLSADVIASGLIDTDTGLSESSNILSVSPNNATLKSGANPNDAVLIADSDDGNSLKKLLLSDIVELSGFFKDTWINADGASKSINHGLNSTDVIIEVYDISLGTTILLDEVKRDDTNNITLTASAAPDALGSGYKVLIKRI